MTTTTDRGPPLRCRHQRHGGNVCQQMCYCEAETQEHNRCCAGDTTASSSEHHVECGHFMVKVARETYVDTTLL